MVFTPFPLISWFQNTSKNHKAPDEKLYERWLQLCHTYYEIMIRESLQLLKNTVTQISDACNLWENLALVQNLGKRKPKVQTRLRNNGLPLLQNSWHGRPNVGIFRAKVVDQKGPRSYQTKCRATSPEESTLLSSRTKYQSVPQIKAQDRLNFDITRVCFRLW